MKDITKNEMLFVLSIFKSPEKEYNSNSIAKGLNVTSMGALKIARRLEKEGILKFKSMGHANFYHLNLSNDYTKQYVKFLLRREAEYSSPYIKRWIAEIKKIKNASFAILFGSVLKKERDAGDIDVLIVTAQKKFQKLKKEIEEINFVNTKKLHPIYQTKKDIFKNIKKQDKIMLNAIKGIVVFGEDSLMEILENEHSKK